MDIIMLSEPAKIATSSPDEVNIVQQDFKKNLSASTTNTCQNPISALADRTIAFIYNNSIPYKDFKELCENTNADESAQQIKQLLSGGNSYIKLKNWLTTFTQELNIKHSSCSVMERIGTCPLGYAIKKNNMTVVKQLLFSLQERNSIFDIGKINLFTQGDRDFNPFSIIYIDAIVEKGDLELVQVFFTLLKDFLDSACACLEYNLTVSPLIQAIYASAKHGKNDILCYILEFIKESCTEDSSLTKKYIEIMSTNIDPLNCMKNYNPLAIAVAKQDITIVKTLLKYGFYANTGYDEYNAVYQAIKNNNIEILKELFRSGTDVNLVKYKQKIKIQLTKRIIFSYPLYMSPLECAVMHSNLDTIKWLIKCGAKHIQTPDSPSYNYPSNCKSTPLHIAILNNNKEVVELLLTTKASHPTNDIAITEEIDHLNAIEYAESLNDTTDRTQIISLLIKTKERID